jgi:hypothetical protein
MFYDLILFFSVKKSSHLRAFVLHQFDALLTCWGDFKDFNFKGNIFTSKWMVKINFCSVIIDDFTMPNKVALALSSNSII